MAPALRWDLGKGSENGRAEASQPLSRWGSAARTSGQETGEGGPPHGEA